LVHIAFASVGGSKFRIAFDGFVEICDREVRLALGQISIASVSIGEGKFRIEFDGFVEICDR